MTDKFDDGGPMHPIQAAVQVGSVVHLIGHASKGMSLWDYYAGQAMVGLGWDAAMELFSVGGADRREAGEQIAMQAGDLADAMIAEKRMREQND